MLTQSNVTLCRDFAQRMINERNLTLAPEFISESSNGENREWKMG